MDMNENEKEEQKSTELVPIKNAEIIFSGSENDISAEEKKKKRRKKRPWRYLEYIIPTASLFIAVCVMTVAFMSASLPYNSEDVPAFYEDGEKNESKKLIYVKDLSDGGKSTAEIYSDCAESVVSIATEGINGSGIGSGFILSEDGYIATANHVIADAFKITVILSSGEERVATLVGGNGFTDIALLKIEAAGLNAVVLGDSSELLAGETVIAIGTPASLDFAGSVCTGEVSFPERVVKIYGEDGMLEKKMTLIQTDAPVNPGNSGCPLFDSQGRVIGMVSMKLGQSFSGVGFAIPINGALNILNKMRMGEEVDESLTSAISVRAPKLGIVGKAYDKDGVVGVMVEKFASDGVDSAAKLKPYDVITHIDDVAVTSAKKLSDAINKYAPGDTVSITVFREGQKLTFEVILG